MDLIDLISSFPSEVKVKNQTEVAVRLEQNVAKEETTNKLDLLPSFTIIRRGDTPPVVREHLNKLENHQYNKRRRGGGSREFGSVSRFTMVRL
jgi:hypothetical protein